MRKNRIVIKINDKNDRDWRIEFYLETSEQRYFLFDQDYTQGIYEYFKDGRSESEILNFKKWRINDRLTKTISKIPSHIKYVTKYVA